MPPETSRARARTSAPEPAAPGQKSRPPLWTGPIASHNTPIPEREQRRTGAQIAQLVEQRIENPRVAGSIPALGTIKSKK